MSSDPVEQAKLKYKQSLTDKAKKLHTLWSQAKNSPDELLSFLHQLTGSSGIYGYDDISVSSATLTEHLITNTTEHLQIEFEKLHTLLVENSQ